LLTVSVPAAAAAAVENPAEEPGEGEGEGLGDGVRGAGGTAGTGWGLDGGAVRALTTLEGVEESLEFRRETTDAGGEERERVEEGGTA